MPLPLLQPDVVLRRHFLETRLAHLKNSGPVFETDAAKAEIAQVESALHAARRRSDEYSICFEHLRRPIAAPETAAQEAPPGRGSNEREPEASRFSSTGTVHDKDLMLRGRLTRFVNNLRQCEVEQRRIADRVLALKETAKLHEEGFMEPLGRSEPLCPQWSTWAIHQKLEVQLQANRHLETVSAKPLPRALHSNPLQLIIEMMRPEFGGVQQPHVSRDSCRIRGSERPRLDDKPRFASPAWRGCLQITQSLRAFDEELRCLLEARVALQQQLLLARLKHLVSSLATLCSATGSPCLIVETTTLREHTQSLHAAMRAGQEQHQELLVIEAMESRSLRLQQDLSSEKKECQQIKTRLEALDASMREKNQCIDNCHVRAGSGLALLCSQNAGSMQCLALAVAALVFM